MSSIWAWSRPDRPLSPSDKTRPRLLAGSFLGGAVGRPEMRHRQQWVAGSPPPTGAARQLCDIDLSFGRAARPTGEPAMNRPPPIINTDRSTATNALRMRVGYVALCGAVQSSNDATLQGLPQTTGAQHTQLAPCSASTSPATAVASSTWRRIRCLPCSIPPLARWMRRWRCSGESPLLMAPHPRTAACNFSSASRSSSPGLETCLDFHRYEADGAGVIHDASAGAASRSPGRAYPSPTP